MACCGLRAPHSAYVNPGWATVQAIVNSVRQAQEVSGVQKVHAVVGGFHLGPAPKDYLTQVVGEIKKLEPDVLLPMHCSGLNFVAEARAQMPNNVLVTTTGSRIDFGA